MRFKALFIAGVVLATGCAATPEVPGAGLLAAEPTPARNCLQYTGSHIRADGSRCIPVPGRVYTLDDIRVTGATTLGGVLLRLDPSLGR